MRFIQLRSYNNYIPANLMMQQLEAEGIRAWLQDEYTVTIDPILTNVVGGIKLMVYEEQWQRAEELAASIESQYRQSAACSNCGSADIHFVPSTRHSGNWFTAIASWLLGDYAVPVKKVYRCFQCGAESSEFPAAQ